jgi:hypothetical protein
MYSSNIENKEYLLNSVVYTILARCDLAENATPDFSGIQNMTAESVRYLGTETGKLAGEVLRDIEKEVKAQRDAEKLEEQKREGLQDENERDEREAGERIRGKTATTGQIRTTEGAIPGGIPEKGVSFVTELREANGTLEGDRRESVRTSRIIHPADVGEESGPGQGNGSNEVGGAHEQPESLRGGDGDRYNLRVTADADEYPHPHPQKEIVSDEGTEAVSFVPSTVSSNATPSLSSEGLPKQTITDIDVEFVLAGREPFRDARQLIEYFTRHSPDDENTFFYILNSVDIYSIR